MQNIPQIEELILGIDKRSKKNQNALECPGDSNESNLKNLPQQGQSFGTFCSLFKDRKTQNYKIIQRWMVWHLLENGGLEPQLN